MFSASQGLRDERCITETSSAALEWAGRTQLEPKHPKSEQVSIAGCQIISMGIVSSLQWELCLIHDPAQICRLKYARVCFCSLLDPENCFENENVTNLDGRPRQYITVHGQRPNYLLDGQTFEFEF